MASLVELEPAPAITGTRPLASSIHHSTTRLCPSWLTVGLSPVVPTGTRPWVPSAICQLTSERNAASSTEPFLNGVTKAVNEPRKFVLIAMDFLRTRVACRPNRRGTNSYRVWRFCERAACERQTGGPAPAAIFSLCLGRQRERFPAAI